jgi:hypothetical protein
MPRTTAPHKGIFLLLAAGLTVLAACSAHSDKQDSKLEVRTPMGEMTAKVSDKTVDVDLPVYPGARPIVETGGSNRAQAGVSAPFLHLKIAASKFETGEPPEKVLDFYRKELARYGTIDEGHGKNSYTKIQGFTWSATSDQTSLAAGQGGSQHVVMVQPAGKGSKFAILYIHAGGPAQPI